MANSESEKKLDISIPIEEGEPLAATPNDKLTITKVQPGTLADGKIKVGDQILSVNGIKIQDANSFFNALRFAPPCANIVILRLVSPAPSVDHKFIFSDEKKVEELAARMHIPADREKLITRRDGYAYFVAKIVYVPGGPKLGLGIKHFQNRVLVSRCDPGSLSAEQLQIGDHVVDIDGCPVTDKDVARDLLIKNLKNNGTITSVVERAESVEAKVWVQKALAVQAAQPPSVQMNSDVLAIAAKERAKLKEPKQTKPSILRAGPITTNPLKFSAQPVTTTHLIASDHEGKALRPVKK